MKMITGQKIAENNNRLWDFIMEWTKVRYELSELTYNTWLKPLRLLRVKGNTLFVLVPLSCAVDYVTKKFKLAIEESVELCTGEKYSIIFQTAIECGYLR